MKTQLCSSYSHNGILRSIVHNNDDMKRLDTALERRAHSMSFTNILPTIYLWLYSPLLELGRFFSFLILYTDGRTPRTGDQPVSKPLPTHRTTRTQNERIQTSLPQVGFETTIPVIERGKTLHALDRVARTTGRY
jgi:hypothetical protein